MSDKIYIWIACFANTDAKAHGIVGHKWHIVALFDGRSPLLKRGIEARLKARVCVCVVDEGRDIDAKVGQPT
jgi:hypothetical protein